MDSDSALSRIHDHPGILFAPSTDNKALNIEAVGYLRTPIAHLKVVCHRDKLKERTGQPDRRSNPWKLYFVLRKANKDARDAGESITVEMGKHEHPTGRVAVRYRPFEVSILAYQSVELELGSSLQGSITLERILDALIDADLIYYQFGTEHEEGCRHWTRTVVKYLEDHEFLAEGSSTKLDGVIHFVYTMGSENKVVATPDEIRPGVFARPKVHTLESWVLNNQNPDTNWLA